MPQIFYAKEKILFVPADPEFFFHIKISNLLNHMRILCCTLLVTISEILSFDSHTGGMAVARPYGFVIDFVRNLISRSAAWFSLIILKFFFTPIFETKIHEKIPWEQKKKIIFEARFS